jgi:hypothetical protein
MAQPPAFGIGQIFFAKPGVRGQDRLDIAGNERRVADGRNAKHWIYASDRFASQAVRRQA